jgi:predicted ATPase
VERAERSEEGWYLPELLRLQGELQLIAGAPPEVPAERFRRSLDLARFQKALSWELRASMSLSRLYGKESHWSVAPDVLASVYDRFNEGLATADLREARDLLNRSRNRPR